ncbi:MAG: hypothetical protein ACOC97_02840 [Myxococcota bacterium]
MRSSWLWLYVAVVGALGCGPSVASASDARLCTSDALSGDSFWEQVDVVEVRSLHEWKGRPWLRQPRGAEVVLRPQQDKTAARLELEAYCDAQRRGGEAGGDPLTVQGVDVEVVRRGPTYVLRLTSEDRGTAREVAERASALGAN